MVKKYIVILLLIVSVSLLAAGCTTTSPQTSPGTGQPTQPPATTGKAYATVWPTISAPPTGTGELFGKITKAGTQGEPLEGAVSYIWTQEHAYDEDTEPAFAKAVTGANGEYRISNIPAGYYKIRVTAPGSLGYHDANLENIDGPTEWNNEE